MDAIPTKLEPLDAERIQDLYKDFGDKSCCASLNILASAILVVGAVIVIFSAAMCQMLPGVNVISDIILPGVVPGICAIVISIPFIIYSVKYTRVKTPAWEIIVKTVGDFIVDKYHIENIKEKGKRGDFFRDSFLVKNWIQDKKQKLVTEVQKYLEEKRGFPKEEPKRRDRAQYRKYERKQAIDDGLMEALKPQ